MFAERVPDPTLGYNDFRFLQLCYTNPIWNQHEILRFLIPFLINKNTFQVILVLFSNFEDKRAKNGAKNQKTYEVNVS